MLAACRATSAPPGFTPLPEVTQRTAVGSWVDVRVGVEGTSVRLSGELVAVSADSIYLFAPDTLRAVPMATVRSVAVARYSTPTTSISAWGLLGTLSTASHGIYALASAPIWLITWTATEVYVNHQSVDKTTDIERLRPYARFPQGIPALIDRRRLVPAVRPLLPGR